MVGKYAGWLMYPQALPNCVYIFQNSMGGSKRMSLTVQDCTFLVSWFSMCKKYPSCSMHTILYPGPPFKVPFAGLFVLEVDPVSNLEGWWCAVHGLLSCFESVFI